MEWIYFSDNTKDVALKYRSQVQNIFSKQSWEMSSQTILLVLNI